jgi:hypothetical protein
MAYDIIGDIHGQADKLHALLGRWATFKDRGPTVTRTGQPSLSATSSIVAPNRWKAS